MKNQRKKYRCGTIVYIENEYTLRNAFRTWPGDKLFKVTGDKISGGKRYVWVNNYSVGIYPGDVCLATAQQKRKRLKEIESERFTKPLITSLFVSLKDIEDFGLKKFLDNGPMIYAQNGWVRGKYLGVSTVLKPAILHIAKSVDGLSVPLSHTTDGIFLKHKFTKGDIIKALKKQHPIK